MDLHKKPQLCSEKNASDDYQSFYKKKSLELREFFNNIFVGGKFSMEIFRLFLLRGLDQNSRDEILIISNKMYSDRTMSFEIRDLLSPLRQISNSHIYIDVEDWIKPGFYPDRAELVMSKHSPRATTMESEDTIQLKDKKLISHHTVILSNTQKLWYSSIPISVIFINERFKPLETFINKLR